MACVNTLKINACLFKLKIHMCLYPRFIKNKRFFSTIKAKNGTYTNEICEDARMLYIPIGCGECIECRQQKAREWQTRLHEEIKVHMYNYFITLTFSNESLEQIANTYKLAKINAIATKATRLFLERYRKKYGKSAKHWLITELGHENTERIHLHGILFMNKPITNEELTAIWKYGRTDTGKFCNARTINYIVKYVTKIDEDHKDYMPIILCSAGLGRAYADNATQKKIHQFDGTNTIETYTLPNGNKIALPIYYRNKFWTQKERDKLWIQRLDKQKRYIRGIEIDVSKGEQTYFNVLAEQQKDNIKLGYGNTTWKKREYELTIDMLKKAKPKT